MSIICFIHQQLKNPEGSLENIVGAEELLFKLSQRFNDLYRVWVDIVTEKHAFALPMEYLLFDSHVYPMQRRSIQFIVECLVSLKHLSMYKTLCTSKSW